MKSLFFTCSIFAFLIACCFTVLSQTPTQLTNNDVDDFFPKISGTNVCWQSDVELNSEIYFWNGTQTTQITNNTTFDFYPNISGNSVVWDGGSANNIAQIYIWNGSNAEQITQNDTCEAGFFTSYYFNSEQYTADVQNCYLGFDGQKAVWGFECKGNSGYYDTGTNLWNGTGVINIDNSKIGTHVNISGNNIVWVGDDGNDKEIYFWNGASVTQVTDNSIDDTEPSISGNNVVWVAYDGSDNEIYFWNGGDIQKITNNNTDDQDVRISGNNVVWVGAGQIFLWNGNTTTNLTSAINGSAFGGYPKILGDKIVWTGTWFPEFNNYDSEIIYYNGTKLFRITDDDVQNEAPELSDTKVTWMAPDSNDYEIFVADLPVESATAVTIREVEFNVFPNPSVGVFNLSMHKIDAAAARITVLNLEGKTVHTSLIDSRLTPYHSIDLTTQPDGMYFVKVESQHDSYQTKLVKAGR